MTINSTAVDLFSYFPGIEVSSQDIIEAELLLYQTLQSKFPTLDLREGTGVRDLLIRPASTLLAMLDKASLLFFQNNSLDTVTDTTPQVFVDSLLSNWFLTRKKGQKAVLNVRLFFAKAKGVVITPDIYFSNDGTRKYFPDATYSFSPTNLTYDSGTNQYYVDVDLSAESVGSSYDLTSGSLIYFSNFDPFFLHAEINYLKQSASDTETNLEFLSRAKDAISTRNLINSPSISARLMEEFSIIDGVYSAGFGDTEMQRDYIKVKAPTSGNEYWMHQGGCVDVYCRVPLTSAILQFTIDSLGKVYLTGPIYKVTRSNLSGGSDPDTLPITQTFTYTRDNISNKALDSYSLSGTKVVCTVANHGLISGQRVQIKGLTPIGYNGGKTIRVTSTNTFEYDITVPLSSTAPTGVGNFDCVDPSLDNGFSTRQVTVLDFGASQANKTVSLVLHYFQDIDGIQTYLSYKENRVLCADLLSRGFNLTLLDISLMSYDGVTPDSAVASESIKSYLLSLTSGQPFVMSDMLSNLYTVGIKSLQNPVAVTYTKYWKDGMINDSGTITDFLEPNDSLNVFMLNSLTTASTLIN